MYGGNICYCKRCNGIIHIIERGDTLYKLSRFHKVSVASILEANPFINMYNLQTGQKICIPVSRGNMQENMSESDEIMSEYEQMNSKESFDVKENRNRAFNENNNLNNTDSLNDTNDLNNANNLNDTNSLNNLNDTHNFNYEDNMNNENNNARNNRNHERIYNDDDTLLKDLIEGNITIGEFKKILRDR